MTNGCHKPKTQEKKRAKKAKKTSQTASGKALLAKGLTSRR